MDVATERAIAERACAQLGLVTAPQLRAAGMSSSTLTRRVASGLLVPVGSRTYRLSGAPDDPRQDVMAAVLDLDGVASHLTAAWLHGLWPDLVRPIDVTVRRGRSRGRTPTTAGRRAHLTTSLLADDVTTIGPIPTFSVARTLMNLAALPEEEVPLDRLADVVEDAVRRRLASDRWLWWLLERRRCRGRNGVARFEDVLGRRASLGPTESWLEREVLRLIDGAGLPRPQVQRRIRRRGRFVARVDFAYDPGMIVLEALGYRHHSTREQQSHDAERASELQLLGYDVHQFTYDQVVRTPQRVAGVVRRALERAAVIARAA